MIPTLKELLEARERISGYVAKTPVLRSDNLDDILGARAWFKCENLQYSGSFKPRGAFNCVLQLPASQREQGVCTHSSGNHGKALAMVASKLGLPAYIVMPQNAIRAKVEGVLLWGGQIFYCDNTNEARAEALSRVEKETGAIFIPPYDYPPTIAGQSTVAAEFLEQVESLQVLLAPLGGGGLLSGTALSAKYFGGEVAVIGGEPTGADDAFRSLNSGKLVLSHQPKTIADGLRTTLGRLPFRILKEEKTEVLLADEEMIIQAMKLIWKHLRVIAEPSGALGLAVALAHPDKFRGKRIGLIISGGNIDLDLPLPWQQKPQ
ncbi:MAG: pyridoxal-phosphate dependent enzyme [Flavobacteriales bacterium]|nr:pyridoxal-phosphate dependent enzyme [Flavobacteriales bacterium]